MGPSSCPLGLPGMRRTVTLAAGWDGGVAMAIYRDHAFLPVDWMVREYPKLADDLRFVERRVREAAAGQVGDVPSTSELEGLEADEGGR